MLHSRTSREWIFTFGKKKYFQISMMFLALTQCLSVNPDEPSASASRAPGEEEAQ